jgi:hypothetical protein
MTDADIVIGALCAWRENRHGGVQGMTSVINVLMNRAQKRNTCVYIEAVKPWQFSSLTAPGDPQLILFPTKGDAEFQTALYLMQQADAGTLADITGAATMYYADSMATPPYWVSSYTFTVEVQNQRFYK